MIRIQLKRATEEFGPIKHYLVVVVPSHLAIKHPDNYTLAEVCTMFGVSPNEFISFLMPLQLTRHEIPNGVVQRSAKVDYPYIAAKFSRDTLPPSFDIGDGQVYETYLNRQIQPGMHYKIFVRAYVESPNIVSSTG